MKILLYIIVVLLGWNAINNIQKITMEGKDRGSFFVRRAWGNFFISLIVAIVLVIVARKLD